MTDPEKRELSLRIATLAEQAGLPGELVWEKYDRCERGHQPYYYIRDDAVNTTGRYCGHCYQEYGDADGYRVPETDEEVEAVRQVFREHPDGFVQRRAKDLTHPIHLLPLVKEWIRRKPKDEGWTYQVAWCDGQSVANLYELVDQDWGRHYDGADEDSEWVSLALALAAALEDEKGEVS